MRRSASTPRATSPPATGKDSLISRYVATFVNRRDRYLTSGAETSWFSKKSRLTNRVLESALRGHISLGLYATAEDGMSRWMAIDCDDDSSARKILANAHLLPANSYLIERSRRGLHLVKLFDPAIPWQAAQRYGLAFAHKAGCDGVEVFPKNGTFSAIRAPMTPHPLTKRIYDWIDADGQILDPWDTLLALTPTPIPEHWLNEPPQPEPSREMHRELPGIFGQLDTGSLLPRGDHHELMFEVMKLTTMRYYSRNKARGLCPWHPDTRPSLAVVEGYFRCFSSHCGVNGGVLAWRKLARERGIMPR